MCMNTVIAGVVTEGVGGEFEGSFSDSDSTVLRYTPRQRSEVYIYMNCNGGE